MNHLVAPLSRLRTDGQSRLDWRALQYLVRLGSWFTSARRILGLPNHCSNSFLFYVKLFEMLVLMVAVQT